MEPITDRQGWKLTFIERSIRPNQYDLPESEIKRLKEILAAIRYKEPATKIITAWFDLTNDETPVATEVLQDFIYQVDMVRKSWAQSGVEICDPKVIAMYAKINERWSKQREELKVKLNR